MLHELRRSPREWASWLATVADYHQPMSERARLARAVIAHRRRWRGSDRIAATLYAMHDGAWTYEHRDADRPRKRTHARLSSVVVDGVRVRVEGRALPLAWRADTRRTADRMSDCERQWTERVRASGALSEQPYTCGQPTCLVCAYHRAGQDLPDLLPLLRGYVEAGCTVVHLTSTQRTVVGDGPVALHDDELPHVRVKHRATADDEDATATGGEHLADAWERLRASLRLHTDGRFADTWRASVLVELRGIECTQKSPRTHELRWHVHAHRLLVLAPGVDLVVGDVEKDGTTIPRCVLGGAWWDATVDRWCEVSEGAERGAQLARVVASPGDTSDELIRAIRQVLKYPGDVPNMTRAGLPVFLACVKGLHVHQRKGDLHATQGAGRLLRALAARHALDAGLTPRAGVDLAHIASALPSPADVEEARAQLVAARGEPCTGAGVAAWVRLLTVPPTPEGEEAPEDDPIVGTAVVLTKEGPRVLTRARLRKWADVGLTLRVAVAAGFVASDRAARALRRDGWRPSWQSVPASALLDGSALLVVPPPDSG